MIISLAIFAQICIPLVNQMKGPRNLRSQRGQGQWAEGSWSQTLLGRGGDLHNVNKKYFHESNEQFDSK